MLDIIIYSLINATISNNISLFFSFIMYVLYTLTGLTLLCVQNDNQKIQKINNILKDKKYGNIDNEGNPIGFFNFFLVNSDIDFHRYLCYITIQSNVSSNGVQITKNMWIISSNKGIEHIGKVLSSSSDGDIDNDDTIDVYMTSHVYFQDTLSKLTVFIDETPKEHQLQIINYIDSYKTEKTRKNIFKQFSVFISGVPGCGKSSVVTLLCKKYKGSLIKYNPTNPGMYLLEIYNKIMPTKDKPLVILIDEIDVRFDAFNTVCNKYIDIQAKDKASWNGLADSGPMFFNNTIWFFLSNKSYDIMHEKYDTSFLRPGRVNIRVDGFGSDNVEIYTSSFGEIHQTWIKDSKV